jgi:hypothetical protein
VEGVGLQKWASLPFFPMFTAGWKRLTYNMRAFAGTPFVYGEDFYNGLLKHAETLEILRLEGCSYSDGTGIHQFMCLAVNLKELYISSDRQHSLSGYLDARTIMDTDWRCDNLEVFVCPIRGVPRPDITRRVQGNLGKAQLRRSSTMEESVDIQRRIYTKLARFTKLRELRMGFRVDSRDSYYQHRREDKEVYRQYDCLAMTLDSGLDILKNLKDLRVVGLEDMEIYIDGDKEQTWFAEHWPHATIEYEDYRTDSDATSASS